jgi:hypothetical protein
VFVLKVSEDNRDYSFAKDSIHHAVGGPQPVSQPKFITPLGTAFLVKKIERTSLKKDRSLMKVVVINDVMI